MIDWPTLLSIFTVIERPKVPCMQRYTEAKMSVTITSDTIMASLVRQGYQQSEIAAKLYALLHVLIYWTLC
jgi:hypothetical protein